MATMDSVTQKRCCWLPEELAWISAPGNQSGVGARIQMRCKQPAGVKGVIEDFDDTTAGLTAFDTPWKIEARPGAGLLWIPWPRASVIDQVVVNPDGSARGINVINDQAIALRVMYDAVVDGDVELRKSAIRVAAAQRGGMELDTPASANPGDRVPAHIYLIAVG